MIAFELHGFLQQFAEGKPRVEVDGAPSAATVRDALVRLFAKHPGLRHRVMMETGEVRQHVNVFVRDESIRFLGGLDASVRDGDVITILPAVSGGR